MTDDFDVELRRRLGVLAAAAPLDGSGGLARMASRVKPDHAAALVPSGLLVAAALLAVIGVAVSGGVGQRSTPSPGTSESAAPGTGPVTTTDTDGAFELTIRSGHATYAAGDPIDVEASLTYRGPDATVDLCDDSDGPIMFGIRERVLGKIDLTPASRLMFAHTTLTRDVPLTKPFAKSGSFPGDDPAAASFRAFFADPILRLPPGAWHLYAAAASCSPGPLHFDLNAEVEITVDEAADMAPSSEPSASARPDSGSVESTVEDGGFVLMVRSAKAVYAEDEPIDVIATLTYVGPDEVVTVREVNLPTIVFSISPDSMGDDVMAVDPTLCIPRVLERNKPITRALPDPRPLNPLVPSSLGTWTISAATSLHVASCSRTAPYLSTSIAIHVVPAATRATRR